ncbi:MAG: hypothetical protein ACM3S1_10165 [Hyphomicrobiales bacterium]
MHHKRLIAGILVAAAAVIAVPVATALGDGGGSAPVTAQAALGNAISYQGRLTEGGAPANGLYDFRFTLYNELVGGSQRGEIVEKDNLQVDNGLFTTYLEFGAGAFDGEGRWLEIAVRPGNSSGDYTVLNPRQLIASTPYALWAKTAGALGLPFDATGASENESTSSGLFRVTNTGGGAAIVGVRQGQAGDPAVADGVVGINDGNGAGVRGQSSATFGVGVEGIGAGTSGVGGHFIGETAVDLEGALRVVGDPDERPAFRVTADAGENTCLEGDTGLIIDHPMANGDSGALLFVTPLGGGPVTVAYDVEGCTADRWVIEGVSDGTAYNVLIVKDGDAE